MDLKRRLSLTFLLRLLFISDSLSILVKIVLANTLNVLDGLITCVKLFAKLLNLHVLHLKHIIATFSLLVQLHNATSEPLKVFEHDKALNVVECFLCACVKSLRYITLLTKGRSDDMLNTPR